MSSPSPRHGSDNTVLSTIHRSSRVTRRPVVQQRISGVALLKDILDNLKRVHDDSAIRTAQLRRDIDELERRVKRLETEHQTPVVADRFNYQSLIVMGEPYPLPEAYEMHQTHEQNDMT